MDYFDGQAFSFIGVKRILSSSNKFKTTTHHCSHHAVHHMHSCATRMRFAILYFFMFLLNQTVRADWTKLLTLTYTSERTFFDAMCTVSLCCHSLLI